MGLHTQLNDVSSDSLPILILAFLVTSFTYLRSLLFSPAFDSTPSFTPITPTMLSRHSYFKVFDQVDDDEEDDDRKEKCIVCLSGFKEGDFVSKLTCCHVFHKVCLNGWIHQLKFSCPLCRSPLVSDYRVGRTRLVSWFAVR